MFILASPLVAPAFPSACICSLPMAEPTVSLTLTLQLLTSSLGVSLGLGCLVLGISLSLLGCSFGLHLLVSNNVSGGFLDVTSGVFDVSVNFIHVQMLSIR
ncbi:hypothetical protein K493DRAFT_47758 [Basidiobolus meristosporus CBS 931.73]|uniref:Uncharacterized protein n=1 Tax=Basidiobolus meristosporus CBS 931.73 TaxID=1314790 RepID=A0A1Y1Y1K7_9FUNG|nr:hypothetical protein K493DRAFT_47758 [Basidiobolus meristosporus CBS 931.73]|eukprot:ORX91901.1 hypothetical protein K493DRAFT_47758 [Basidiobolus meristosporus CBS 931.73]